MSSIEIIIRDDNGNIIRSGTAQPLNLKRQANLDSIEAAVEDWRKQALPEIEAQLLHQAQAEFNAGEKTT